jgi:hypothetical protein
MVGRAQKLFGFFSKIKEKRIIMNNHINRMRMTRCLRTISRVFEGWRYIAVRDKLREHCR